MINNAEQKDPVIIPFHNLGTNTEVIPPPIVGNVCVNPNDIIPLNDNIVNNNE